MFVLDTNTLVYFFRGQGAGGEAAPRDASAELAVPTVVVYELETGIAKSTAPTKRRFGIAEATGGRDADRADGHLIAGTALAAGGVLVSRHVSEYGRVPGSG
jgi:tRNA(fMet)-specific endonuclease VapC